MTAADTALVTGVGPLVREPAEAHTAEPTHCNRCTGPQAGDLEVIRPALGRVRIAPSCMSGSSGSQSLTWTEEIRCISNLLSDHDIINFQLYGTVYEVYVIEYNIHPGSLLMC